MSWLLVPISEFCETGSGGTPSRKQADYYEGDIPWIKSGDLREKTVTKATEFITELAIKKSSAKVVPKGAILLAMYGATVGRMAMLGVDAATNQAVCSIVPDEKKAFPKYVYYALLNKVPDFLRSAVGGAQPNISQGMIKDTKIPLPYPDDPEKSLKEQKRIAAILDKADGIRRKRQQAIQLADDFLRSVFLDMFGDPVMNPKGWEVKPVGEICSCIVPGRDKPKSFTGETPWVTTNDLEHLDVTSESKKFIGLSGFEISEVKAKIVPRNSVLMTCVGDLGTVSIAGNDMVINQQLHAFLPNKYIDSSFLSFALSFQKGFMMRMASSTTLPYMNKTICNSVPLINPPFEVQKIFGDIVKKNRVIKSKFNSSIQEPLFEILSQKAFKGEL